MAKEEKESQAKKMFGHSPKMERGEDGKMAIKKEMATKEDDMKEGEDKDGSGQQLPVSVRHSMERHDMHHTMEREHHMHDMGGHGSKEEMHSRHEKMRKEMHARHEKEHAPEMGKESEKE